MLKKRDVSHSPSIVPVYEWPTSKSMSPLEPSNTASFENKPESCTKRIVHCLETDENMFIIDGIQIADVINYSFSIRLYRYNTRIEFPS